MKKGFIAWVLTGYFSVLGFSPKATAAGVKLSVDQDTYVKVGYRLQVWGQFAENQAASGRDYQKDFRFRRNRIWIQGQINNWVRFFYQTDERAGGLRDESGTSGGLETRDAWITLDLADYFKIQAGIFKVPFSRQRNESGFAQLALDFAFVEARTMSAERIGGKRDRGVALWGNLAGGLIQYRLAFLDGKTSLDGKDNPRYSGRIQFSLFEPERGWSFKGTYLGKQKVLTIGAGYDFQAKVTGSTPDIGDYRAWTIDGFLEYPLGKGTPTLEGALFHYDTGGKSLKAQGNGWYLQGGWLFSSGQISQEAGPCSIQLFARWERWNSDDNSPGNDQDRWSVGVNYYIQRQSAKVTLAWTGIRFDQESADDPSKRNHSIITAQLQIMF